MAIGQHNQSGKNIFWGTASPQVLKTALTVPEDIREKERSGRNHGPRSTQWLLVISTTQRSANDMEAALPVCLYKLRGTSKNQGRGDTHIFQLSIQDCLWYKTKCVDC